MIKLNKTPTPPVLTTNGVKWTQELLAQLEGGVATDAARHRYRDAGIKAALIAETNRKCAYCESYLLHVAFGHIEHILPRSGHPELSFEWINLTLACEQCNNRKSDYDSTTEPLVNPYTDDPAEHLLFAGNLVTHLSDQPGLVTVLTLDLNRDTLLDRRREKIEQLLLLIDKWNGLSDGSLKSFVWDEIEHQAAPTAELSATAASYLRARGLT